MIKKQQSPLVYSIGILAFMLASYSIFIFFDEPTQFELTKEDGVIQWMGALGFLFASVGFFYLFLKDVRSQGSGNKLLRRNIFWLLLGILFFVGFGEEISWGQRIFNIETPEELEKINVQKEINIHNLVIFKQKWLNVNRLFSLFWFAFCLMIPIASIFIKPIRALLEKIGMPIVPLFIGIFFMVNYVISKIIPKITGDSDLAGHLLGTEEHRVVELKEMIFAVLFFVIAVYFIIDLSKKGQKSPKDIGK